MYYQLGYSNFAILDTNDFNYNLLTIGKIR